MTNIKIGKPFFFGIGDFRDDGTIDNFDTDGHPGIFKTKKQGLNALEGDFKEYGGTGFLYECKPIARIEDFPFSVDIIEDKRTRLTDLKAEKMDEEKLFIAYVLIKNGEIIFPMTRNDKFLSGGWTVEEQPARYAIKDCSKPQLNNLLTRINHDLEIGAFGKDTPELMPIINTTKYLIGQELSGENK